MTSTRLVLMVFAALVACVLVVSATPVSHNDIQLMEAGTSLELNILNKRGDRSYKKHKGGRRHKKNRGRKNRKTSTTTKKRTTTTRKTTTTKWTPTTTTKKTKTKTTASPTVTVKELSQGGGSGSYSGDGTWYAPGLGSCGTVNSASDMIAALNHVQMANGENPNHNPLCGKYITIHGPEGSVRVEIKDTCPGCGHGDVDLSPAAFSKIANLDMGRIPITWSFD
ncbi:RlpA-like double-psi beta-barrel-protein domain-containing protein-containing protein [Pilobolus umbonatus]|nr:RlpA-like double-psi beta-barrel-protein domain-containing protein-containing protein [Pilobolus umbonatus]